MRIHPIVPYLQHLSSICNNIIAPTITVHVSSTVHITSTIHLSITVSISSTINLYRHPRGLFSPEFACILRHFSNFPKLFHIYFLLYFCMIWDIAITEIEMKHYLQDMAVAYNIRNDHTQPSPPRTSYP